MPWIILASLYLLAGLITAAGGVLDAYVCRERVRVPIIAVIAVIWPVVPIMRIWDDAAILRRRRARATRRAIRRFGQG